MSIYRPELSFFDIDFARGRQSELWVSDLRKNIYGDAIEVKRDSKAVHTGKFYIEYACRGRDGKWRYSGIKTTKAKIWIIQYGAHPFGFIIETSAIKGACRAALNKYGDLARAEMTYGENPTRGILIDIDDIKESRDKSLDEYV